MDWIILKNLLIGIKIKHNTNMQQQLELLKQYGVENYTIIDEKITINENLILSSLTEVHPEFLKDVTINGSLNLRSLIEVDKDFLKGTTINGDLYFDSLTQVHPDFLKQVTIKGNLWLASLTEAHPDFLKGTSINGGLYLRSLTEVHPDFLKGATINRDLWLNSLTEVHPDFLQGTTINGSLYLNSLTEVDKNFLQGTTVNGSLILSSLTQAHKDFLQGTTINGYLSLDSLTEAHPDFLQNTTINGDLCLNSLTLSDIEILRKNVNKLEVGYNQEWSYCYYDGILSKVLNVKTIGEYTIYQSPFEFVCVKGNYSAHGKTIRKAIEDLEFKLVSKKFKTEPIKPDTPMTVKHYRLITGACDNGVRSWMRENNIPFKVLNAGTDEEETVEESPMLAEDLLPILEESNAYGLDNFLKLINF